MKQNLTSNSNQREAAEREALSDRILQSIRDRLAIENQTPSDFHTDRMSVYHEPVYTHSKGGLAQLDRYVFIGPETAHAPLKLAIFGGLTRDRGTTKDALIALLRDLQGHPELANGLHLYIYPTILGPDDSFDVVTDLWKDSDRATPYLVEREFGVIGFDGVISLHERENLGGLVAHLFGAHRTLICPLVDTTYGKLADSLPAAVGHDRSVPQKFSLTAGGHFKPRPFELTLHVPSALPAFSATAALRFALHSVISEYLAHASHASDI